MSTDTSLPDTPVPDDPTTSFSIQIREATATAHRTAERSAYLAALVGGSLPLRDYGRLIAQHHAVYEALEGGNDAMRADPAAGPFVDDAVVRLPALERDLVAVLGTSWPEAAEVALVPATVEYCDRLREVRSAWPGGWVAHQYVRYLGDLSGGLFIRRAIETNYSIDETSGTAFYDFPKVPDPAAWKDAYRARLDDAPWDAAERARIIDEILAAYDWNTRLLEELGG
ncbi:heme oxygenase (biliverdin-producing) [Actinospongicola halichondriae]|uniref:biliverdin-producing heme oxygenase n=1 Tax=Actinospongicola halichondriae TaxID=3236844 RepID=UPI003D4BEC36